MVMATSRRNATGHLVEGHTLGFSTFEFVVNDPDNDRLTIDILAGAAFDAAGNPSRAPMTYTVYKWPGWFTTIGAVLVRPDPLTHFHAVPRQG